MYKTGANGDIVTKRFNIIGHWIDISPPSYAFMTTHQDTFLSFNIYKKLVLLILLL